MNFPVISIRAFRNFVAFFNLLLFFGLSVWESLCECFIKDFLRLSTVSYTENRIIQISNRSVTEYLEQREEKKFHRPCRQWQSLDFLRQSAENSRNAHYSRRSPCIPCWSGGFWFVPEMIWFHYDANTFTFMHTTLKKLNSKISWSNWTT